MHVDLVEIATEDGLALPGAYLPPARAARPPVAPSTPSS